MTDQAAELDGALEQVIAAARAHLAAVKLADGAVDDEQVWRSYVELNNASFAYDQLLLDRFGEVTPWETEQIDLRVAEDGTTPYLTQAELRAGRAPTDPYPTVVSVRQRRDYRVPSVAALLAVAEESAQRVALDDEVEPPESMTEAVLELVRDGDGSLAALDIPELEPIAGVVTVTEVSEPLDLDLDDSDQLFALGEADRVVGRLDEEPYLESLDEDSLDDDGLDDDGPDELDDPDGEDEPEEPAER